MKMINSVTLCLVLCFGFLVFATVPDSERQALVDFYTSLNGEGWNNNNNWLTGDPCENEWNGIFCSYPNKDHIVQIVRQGQKLNGTFPSSLSDLTQLEDFFISFNPLLVGTLPPFYDGLESLTSLTLEQNGLSGSIPPNLGNIPNLNNLWLTENFTGTIPDDLFGSAPYQSFTLTGLEITGTVPDSFCKIPPSLGSVYLSGTQLSGTFPDCLDNFPSLASFECNLNSLTGTIPTSLSKLPLLTDVGMYRNQLTGTLPEFSSSTFFSLAFSDNHLEGTIPDSYQNIFGVLDASYLYLNSNQLTGTIPDWTCNLGYSNVSDNRFQCPEPSCCGSQNYICDNCGPLI